MIYFFSLGAEEMCYHWFNQLDECILCMSGNMEMTNHNARQTDRQRKGVT